MSRKRSTANDFAPEDGTPRTLASGELQRWSSKHQKWLVMKNGHRQRRAREALQGAPQRFGAYRWDGADEER